MSAWTRAGRARRGLQTRLVERTSHLRPRPALAATRAYVRDRVGRRRYRQLSEAELRATRRSDTVFVFGSGKSILDITPAEWERIADHDTIGFSQFQEGRYVRIDYHLIGEVHDLDKYTRLLRENPFYDDTIYVVQEGWRAHAGNDVVGRGLLPERARVFRFRRVSRGAYAPPSRSFDDGLVHVTNSSISTTNFALLLGWKRIVLAGVDLYDKEYFWVPKGVLVEGEQPTRTTSMRFPNADVTVDTFRRWRALVDPEGVELLTYNPRSLLAEALDTFSWERLDAGRQNGSR